jgi:hypothetical protein
VLDNWLAYFRFSAPAAAAVVALDRMILRMKRARTAAFEKDRHLFVAALVVLGQCASLTVAGGSV